MSYISRVAKGTCPHCGTTKVFKERGSIFLFKLPVMNEKCTHCGYQFHRETGFYFGAMYMSYAITVAEMVAIFVVGFLLELSFMQMFIAIVVMTLLLSMFNYRLSRLMWLNIFYNKDEEI